MGTYDDVEGIEVCQERGDLHSARGVRWGWDGIGLRDVDLANVRWDKIRLKTTTKLLRAVIVDNS